MEKKEELPQPLPDILELPQMVKLLDLNDDCLALIFSQMRCLEQIQMTKVCQRFRYIIVELVWPSDFSEMRTYTAAFRGLRPSDYRVILHHIARTVQKITIDVFGRNRLPVLLPVLLSFDYPQLHTLYLGTRVMEDQDLRLLGIRCPALEKLVMYGCKEMRGAYIKDIHNLKELRIIQCALASRHIREILDGRLTKLTHLDLTGHCSRQPPLEQLISEAAGSRLTHLTISLRALSPNFLEFVRKLANLKVLRFDMIESSEIWNAKLLTVWAQFYQYFRGNVVELRCQDMNELNLIDGVLKGGAPVFDKLEKFHMISWATATPIRRLLPILRYSPLKEFYMSDEVVTSRPKPLVGITEWLNLIMECPQLKLVTMKSQILTMGYIFELVDGLIGLMRMRAITEQKMLVIRVLDSSSDPMSTTLSDALKNHEKYKQQNFFRIEALNEVHYPDENNSALEFHFAK